MRLPKRYITLLTVALSCFLAVTGQDVNVSVTPVRNILPPQVMYYISNPGQYFNISIQNTTNEAKQIYFGVELRQISPSSGLEIIVPGKTMPQRPYEVPASGTKVMNAAEMRSMFNHVRMEDITMPDGLFDNVVSGSFGNLPEGTYEMTLLAYKWDPYLSSPLLISNPVLSRTVFSVCYQAKAPEWIMPVPAGDFNDKEIATLSKQTPMLSWTAPVVNCDPRQRKYTYDLKIVQQLPLQAIDEAIERNPVVYQTTGLQMPQCIIPINVVKNLSPNETYLAQINAKSNATQAGSLDYINIINDGKSNIKMFRLKDYSEIPEQLTTYSRPEITKPSKVPGQTIIQLDVNGQTIEWSKPQPDVTSSSPVSFAYDIRIVKPTTEYDISTTSGILAAADNFTPIYESKSLRTTKHTISNDVLQQLNADKMYLVQVIAHPDTVTGSYKKLQFEGEGKSLPRIFTTISNIIYRPVLESPKPYTAFDFHDGVNPTTICDFIFRDSPIVKWKPSNIKAVSGKPLKIVYDLKIVDPGEYNVTAEGIQKALDNEKPVFEQKDIDGTEFSLPFSLFERTSENKAYLVQVTAHATTPLNREDYRFVENGRSIPAIVVLHKEANGTLYSAPKLVHPTPYINLEHKFYDGIDPDNPVIEWTAPEQSGKATDSVSFSYNLKVVLPSGNYDISAEGITEAAEQVAPLYEANNLKTTSHRIPKNIIERIDTTKMYVVRVYAITDTTDFKTKRISLLNGGKSAPALVRFAKATADSSEIIGLGGLELTDSLYNFVNPEIIVPKYLPENGARKEFLNSDIAVKWHRPSFEGGTGAEPDSISFVYDVELFAAKDYVAKDEMLQRQPIYTLKGTKELSDTIHWEDLDGKVEKGDYMMLRVKPTALNETSVAFLNDSINVVDFAMSEIYTNRYFQCANQVEISNEKPTSASVADLKGKSVHIGEYELVLDGQLEAIDDQPGHFKGTGHVIWEPLKLTWKLAVKFSDIAINTDNQVFDGIVQTYDGGTNKMKSSEVVEKLFSDWGIDNLIGDSGIPYADKLQGNANDKIKGIAEQLPIDQYYQDYLDGKARVMGLLDGNVENVTFPLEIPESINPTPVNLTISTMKFAPTYATMDLFGTFVVPETKATKGQILVFGAPRMCISPQTLIPEGGTVALLKDFEVVDPKTDFKCKFLAPKDVIEPEDGCFVSWSQNKFEWLNIDMDMTMPSDLKKVVAGKRTDESPKLHLSTKIQEWENFIAEGSLDSFEHVDLPGYVFTGETAIVDLAANSNHKDMGAFPDGYKLENSGLSKGTENEWTGLYFKELSMAFPSSIKVGNGKEPMKVAVKDLFIDKSGLTLDCGIVNAINYRTGDNATIGGFKFSLDEIMVSIVQNDFKKFGFNGKFEIPLFKGEVDYACNIYNQTFTKKGGGHGFAYVFTTSQIEDLNFDFMLGDLSLDKDLTYLLVEAIENEKGETDTNVELLVGGSVEIAGTKTVNKTLAKLPFKLQLPGIRFCKMRIANNDGFESVYEHDRQVRAAEATETMIAEVNNSNAIGAGWFNEASKIDFGEDSGIYLNFGQWGCASPQKKIGPFEFSLKNWGFALQREGSKPYIGITLGGDITFCDDLKIGAYTEIEIQSWVNNMTDLSNISLNYKGVQFREASFDIETAIFAFKGTLKCADDPTKDTGYAGQIAASVKGGIFEVDINGGYYDHKEDNNNFSWGFFDIMAGGKCGIPLGAISMNDIHGGFYFNCAYNPKDKLRPKPKKGVIGIIAGMGISTADQVTLKGDLDLTVVYDRKVHNLSTFIFKGGVKCVGGMIDSRVNMVYEDNPQEQYFQLDITVDASLDGGINDLLTELNSELEQAGSDLGNYAGSFANAVSDNNDSKTGSYDKTMKKYDEKKSKDKDKTDDGIKAKGPGATVSLDFRVGHKKQGNDQSTKWHVYLGEPEWDKRCSFVLVDFKSKIVTVSVGANAYICLGNELPNNGELPEIPAKVRNFLNGSSKGSVANDDISAANNARERAKKRYIAMGETTGGVMMGASVWGYVNVDLGLFYGDMGATAGFDISLRHLQDNARCVNLKGGRPGRNNWYGEGQLYAYLYAKFGFRVYLGFFKKKIDLLDCGIGGVLRAGLPNPNYFTGKARVKVRLLDGLIDIDKRFMFECGNVCEMFYGNALDDYQLFEDCNIGSSNWEEAVDNPLDWEIQSRPVVTTQADLNRPIAVADPTELERLRNSSMADNEDDETLERFASRKFKFEIIPDSVPVLTEYRSLSDAQADRSGNNREVEYLVNNNKVTLNLTVLNPNCFYRLRVKGRAMEYIKEKWQHPEVFDTIDNKWKHLPWSQTKDFFFVTNNKQKTLADDEELQPHVALAYPNNWENFKEASIQGGDRLISAMPIDLKYPTISLRHKMKGRSYIKGNLKWYVYQKNKVIATAPNKWIENDSISIMTPAGGLPKFNGAAQIILRYEWVEQKLSEATWIKVNSYEVYGNSREGILASERANLKAKLKSGGAIGSNTSSSGSGSNTNSSRRGLPSNPLTSGGGSLTIGNSSSAGSNSSAGNLTLKNTPSPTAPTTPHKHATSDKSDPLSSYRIEVAKVDYFNMSDDANEDSYGFYSNSGKQVDTISNSAGRYRVIIYKKDQGMVDVHRSKDLYSMRVTAFDDMKADDLFESPKTYMKPFMGTRLNSLSLMSIGEYLEQNPWSDDDLIGTEWPSGKFASINTNGFRYYRVAADPFMYISYLSNLFFIGGPKYVSASSNFDFSVQSPESMYMQTPYGTWNFGLLGGKDSKNNVSSGYSSVRDAVVMNRKRIYNTFGTLWPLYTTNSEYYNNILGENTAGLIRGIPLTERAYAELFNDLYSACGRVSDAIPNYTNNVMSKADMRQWISVRKGKIFSYGGKYGHISLQLPAYQFALIYNAASFGGLKPNKTFEVPNSALHRRIMNNPKVGPITPSSSARDRLQSTMGRKLYYSSMDNVSYVNEKDYKKNWEHVDFKADKIADYNKMEFKFTRYRVNAWNFNKLQWTVFNSKADKEISEPYNFFYKTYNRTYAELLQKLNSPSKSQNSSQSIERINQNKRTTPKRTTIN